MSAKHPTPWTFSADDEFEDSPILDKDGGGVLVRDSGCYPPDLDTCREIVEAVNAVDATLKLQRTLLGWSIERDRLREERDAALAHAGDCERDAADERAKRARAVEEAQREANQRADRLADLVRRMLPCVEKAFGNAKRTGAAVKGLCALRGVDSGGVDEILEEWSALLREAREAVGEVAE